MDNALLEPTEVERVVTAELRVHCQRLLRESSQRQESVSLALSLRPKDIDGLLRRDDWTLPAALRIAQALGVNVQLKLQVH